MARRLRPVRRRRLTLSAAAALFVAALLLAVGTGRPARAADGDPVARGRVLYLQGCSSCHGLDARGVRDRGPSLVGAGGAAADFYLSTGRMPLSNTGEQPIRAQPAYKRPDIDALVAYVGSLGGPPVPRPNLRRGALNEGFRAFTDQCAGCHQSLGRGGIVTGGVAPSLLSSTPTQVAEAVRIGPYLMPAFGPGTIDDATLASIIRYVEYAKDPDNRGGWSVGNIGPVPEGLVAWLLGGLALLLVARLIGARGPDDHAPTPPPDRDGSP